MRPTPLAFPSKGLLPPLMPAAPKKCAVCIHSPIPKSIYCLLCRHLVYGAHKDRLPRKLAAIDSYVPAEDRFHCALSDVVLDLKDTLSPYYRNFIPVIPGNRKNLLMICELMGKIKMDLTVEELNAVVPELHDHHTLGRPFKRDIIGFDHWYRLCNRQARSIPPVIISSGNAHDPCEICIRPRYPRSIYCPRCHNLILSGQTYGKIAKRQALKDFYDPVLDGFICAYTGVLLNTDNPHDPYYLVYDHQVPGQKKLVLAASWVNSMKCWLTDGQFWNVIAEYTNHLRTGEPFDKGVITRKEWKAALRFGGARARRVA